MNHGSLFSGIGGFDLAAEWMGWNNVFHCEWNDFGRKVLHHYWPEAIQYGDITKTDFTVHHGQIDILTGGFPCQPYSMAGKRKGKDDERHLWPEMLRSIREISPRWIVGENVRGLTNWNGGMVFDEVQSDLESEGYEVLPFLLPAAAVNAPHRRDRIWFVAYRDVHGFNERNGNNEEHTSQGRQYAQRDTQQSHGDESTPDTSGDGWERGSSSITSKKGLSEKSQYDWELSRRSQRLRGDGHVTDSETIRRQRGNKQGSGTAQWQLQDGQTIGDSLRSKFTGCCGDGDATDAEGAGSEGQCKHRQRQVQPNGRNSRTIPTGWQDFPTQPPICGGDDGLPAELDGVTFPKWRNESIKGYGNAIVPQVALQIFRAIQAYEQL